MRACAVAHVGFLGLVALGALFAACSGGAAPPSPPTGGGPDPQGSADLGASPAPAPPPPAPAAPIPKKEPQTGADCKHLASVITNEPPSGGVVMNNAMTSADAGTSDRFASMVDIVKAKRDAFRCCFDLWGKNHRGGAGKVVAVWTLKPDGALEKIEVDAAKSTLRAPEVDACIVDVAKGLTYPPSPSKKMTTFTYPFDFKAR
jgi:hypothetical protein